MADESRYEPERRLRCNAVKRDGDVAMVCNRIVGHPDEHERWSHTGIRIDIWPRAPDEPVSEVVQLRAELERLTKERDRLRVMILKLGQDWDSPSDETFSSTLGHFVDEVRLGSPSEGESRPASALDERRAVAAWLRGFGSYQPAFTGDQLAARIECCKHHEPRPATAVALATSEATRLPLGKVGQVPGPMKADGSWDWVDPPRTTEATPDGLHICEKTAGTHDAHHCGYLSRLEEEGQHRSTAVTPMVGDFVRVHNGGGRGRVVRGPCYLVQSDQGGLPQAEDADKLTLLSRGRT